MIPDLIHFNAVRATLQKMNRIILGNHNVTVDIQNPDYRKQSAPAWSEGSAIYLNAEIVSKYRNAVSQTKYMRTVLGMNYHELAHVLYTPGTGTRLFRDLQVERLLPAYNILEDQRIETMLIKRYSSVHRFFSVTIMEFVVSGNDPNTFALTHGRRYLPRKVRDSVERRYVGDELTKNRVKAIIDEYRLIPFTNQGDYDKALSLVREFSMLLGQSADDMAHDMNGVSVHIDGGCSAQDSAEKNRATPKERRNTSDQVSKDTQEQDTQEAQERAQESDDTEDDAQESTEDAESNADSEAEGNPQSDDSSDTQSDTEPQSGSGDSPDADDSGESGITGSGDIDTPDADDSGNSGATGNGVSTNATNEAEDESDNEAIERIFSEMLEDEQLNREIQETVKTVGYRQNDSLASQHSKHDSFIPITAEMRAESRKVYREIAAIQESVAPGWEYGSSEGQINVSRYLTSEHGDEDIWDRWDEGKEQDVGCEVFIGLDCSKSMAPSFNRGNKMDMANQALWMIKSAFDKLDIQVTVVEFGEHNKERVVYGKGDRASHAQYLSMQPNHGSTWPDNMCAMGKTVMDNTKNKCKLFIAITDGVWPPNASWSDIVPTIDATRVMVGIDMWGAYGSTGELFDHSRNFEGSDISGLCDLMRESVATLMKRSARA